MAEVTEEDLQRLEATIRESSRVKYGTHYADCHFEHHGCAVLVLAATLRREREERERAESDTARLDWLEAQTDGRGWIARDSSRGHGYRLHNTSRPGSSETAREAIDAAMKQEHG